MASHSCRVASRCLSHPSAMGPIAHAKQNNPPASTTKNPITAAMYPFYPSFHDTPLAISNEAQVRQSGQSPMIPLSAVPDAVQGPEHEQEGHEGRDETD
jgi:hypothetical protein